MKLKSATRLTLFSALTMTVGNLLFFFFVLYQVRGVIGASVDKFASAFIIAAVAFSVGTAFISYFISSLVVDRFLNPVRTMIAKVKEIGERRFANARLSIDTGEDELAEYATAFNEMALKLSGYIEKQKRFVSDASHELATPITIINGHADMLIRWGRDDPETLNEGLHVIRNEALRMSELVENLLFFARSDSRRQEYVFADEDINALLTACADEARRLYPDYQIICEAGELPVRRCDGEAIRRVLRILISNAVKHGGDNRRVTLSAERKPDGRVELRVADNGPGIPEGQLERVFDRFYRADESRVKKTGGSGLGLAIAKEIIERHGGTIRAENDTKLSSNLHLFTITFSF
jgi:signal transduction histidine kinase